MVLVKFCFKISLFAYCCQLNCVIWLWKWLFWHFNSIWRWFLRFVFGKMTFRSGKCVICDNVIWYSDVLIYGDDEFWHSCGILPDFCLGGCVFFRRDTCFFCALTRQEAWCGWSGASCVEKIWMGSGGRWRPCFTWFVIPCSRFPDPCPYGDLCFVLLGKNQLLNPCPRVMLCRSARVLNVSRW